jgi:gamma-glutamyltranspeptidase/glutathione hydrolase
MIRRAARFVLLSALVLAVASCAPRASKAPLTQPPPAATAVPSAAVPRAAVTSTRGIVASAHPLASEAGVAMLRAGGNAVDAAVAAAFAVGVAEPNASGLGGEGLIVIYDAAKKTATAIDYRSTLPASARFEGRPPEAGYGAVAVPGALAGLTHALHKYGTKALAEVMAPSVTIAEEGFLVSATLANAVTENFATILEDEALAAVFCPGGLPLEAGGRVKNPDLAATLRAIASGGPDVFYRGDIAQRIEAAALARGGFLSRADLAAYRAIERAPVRGVYRGHEVVSGPPPVAGIALIQALQILEHFDVASLGAWSPARVHLTAEALKHAFADYSAHVADPGFVTVPVAGLTSTAYAKGRAAGIRLDAISRGVKAGTPDGAVGSPSTTSLAVIDGAGNAAVITQTISDFFGAKVMVPGTGIILNNEVKNFSSRGINAMAPGKRMRTTIAPTVVLKDGQLVAALGTPGAARIVSTMTLLVSNVIDFHMGIQEAIDAPRFYARDTEEALAVESRLPAATLEALKALGYTLDVHGDFDLFFGGAQGILRDPATGRLTGGADPRRDGAVAGY